MGEVLSNVDRAVFQTGILVNAGWKTKVLPPIELGAITNRQGCDLLGCVNKWCLSKSSNVCEIFFCGQNF